MSRYKVLGSSSAGNAVIYCGEILVDVGLSYAKLKDDVKVLYYEYYAAFKEKNKNKADRKEVGL